MDSGLGRAVNIVTRLQLHKLPRPELTVSGITVSWEAVPRAHGYLLWKRWLPGSGKIEVNRTSYSFADDILVPGNTYEFWVAARGRPDLGTTGSDWAKAFIRDIPLAVTPTFTPSPTPTPTHTPTPTNTPTVTPTPSNTPFPRLDTPALVGCRSGNGSPCVSAGHFVYWRPVQNALNYRLTWSLDGEQVGQRDGTTATVHVINGLVPGNNYAFTVVALPAAGASYRESLPAHGRLSVIPATPQALPAPANVRGDGLTIS